MLKFMLRDVKHGIYFSKDHDKWTKLGLQIEAKYPLLFLQLISVECEGECGLHTHVTVISALEVSNAWRIAGQCIPLALGVAYTHSCVWRYSLC